MLGIRVCRRIPSESTRETYIGSVEIWHLCWVDISRIVRWIIHSTSAVVYYTSLLVGIGSPSETSLPLHRSISRASDRQFCVIFRSEDIFNWGFRDYFPPKYSRKIPKKFPSIFPNQKERYCLEFRGKRITNPSSVSVVVASPHIFFFSGEDSATLRQCKCVCVSFGATQKWEIRGMASKEYQFVTFWPSSKLPSRPNRPSVNSV